VTKTKTPSRGNLRIKNSANHVSLIHIATKLQHCESLDADESLLAGRLIRAIADGTDVLPEFWDTLVKQPPKSHLLWVAMHCRLLKPDGAAAAELEVAEIWGLSSGRVKTIEREHRADCDAMLAGANEQTQSLLLQQVWQEWATYKQKNN
jgi:hypothetical protein